MKKSTVVRRQTFQKAFDKYGATPRALKWRNAESAEIRYRNLIKDLELDNKTILDIGCGFGDIVSFIEKTSKNFTYTGIDIVPDFIKEAQARHPKYTFITGAWEELIKPTEIILCSGVLNNKVIEDQYTYREKAISLLFRNTKDTLAFNMAGGYPQPENKENYKVFYVDSLKMLKFCFSMTSKIIARHHYRKKDFTVLMFK